MCNRSDLSVMNDPDNHVWINGAGVALVTKMTEMTQSIVLKPSFMVNAHLAASLPNYRN